LNRGESHGANKAFDTSSEGGAFAGVTATGTT